VAVDRQTIDLLSDREGVTTIFGFAGKRNKPGMSSGSLMGFPRLPLLTKGTWLEIEIQVEEFHFYTEALEIAQVTYLPIHRVQEDTLLVHGLMEELRPQLSDAIYASLHNYTVTPRRVQPLQLLDEP
jgi:hypothetical protein